MEIFYGLLASQSWADILNLVKVKQATLKNNRIEWEQISSLLESEFVKYVQNEKDVLVSTLCTEYIKLQISGYIKVSPQGLEKIELIGFNASLAQSESDAKNFSRLCYHSEPVITYKQNPIKQKNKTSGEIEQKSLNLLAQTGYNLFSRVNRKNCLIKLLRMYFLTFSFILM